MIGAFWNIRGLGKTGRKEYVIDLIKNNNLDFVGIQETKKEDFDVEYLDALAGRKQFCWNWIPAKGTAGGILMGFDVDVFEIIEWKKLEFIMCGKVKHKRSKKCVSVPQYMVRFLMSLNKIF